MFERRHMQRGGHELHVYMRRRLHRSHLPDL